MAEASAELAHLAAGATGASKFMVCKPDLDSEGLSDVRVSRIQSTQVIPLVRAWIAAAREPDMEHKPMALTLRSICLHAGIEEADRKLVAHRVYVHQQGGQLRIGSSDRVRERVDGGVTAACAHQHFATLHGQLELPRLRLVSLNDIVDDDPAARMHVQTPGARLGQRGSGAWEAEVADDDLGEGTAHLEMSAARVSARLVAAARASDCDKLPSEIRVAGDVVLTPRNVAKSCRISSLQAPRNIRAGPVTRNRGSNSWQALITQEEPESKDCCAERLVHSSLSTSLRLSAETNNSSAKSPPMTALN
eukprot:CAMPEP_0177452038 /NCGR_PEP_ID=MMETSP0369-20130122/10098_1 /TAXON_ID=447022 ORGANISM="Scrippsiella hangoei-like, Strain SHHI-4" /NCGR_SAMPLE_ID=MMETSP0369 /ASSEMBLY_ACC=CAM_ASM_000364 /LENGTH=305 /DNA_ID=CAMNT_0018924691 /DNA_START=37 /DNA_END=953 /DNA_ORIENTATION=-